jgi:hypothetical protein
VELVKIREVYNGDIGYVSFRAVEPAPELTGMIFD